MSSSWRTSVISELWDFEGSSTEIDFFFRQCLMEKKQSKEEYQSLAADLMNAATMPILPDKKLLSCLSTLVRAKLLSHSDLINTVVKFNNISKIESSKALVGLIDYERKEISCSFNDQTACDNLINSCYSLLKWLVNLLNEYMNEECDKPFCCEIIDLVNNIINDKFFFHSIKLSLNDHEEKFKNDILKVVEELKESFEDEYPQLLQLNDFLQVFLIPLKFESNDIILELCKKQNRSGIKSLTAIFMTQRTLTPVVEVAETFINFSSIFEYTEEQLLSDFFQAAVLIMLDHQNSRHDFRVLGLQFFFGKIPKILKHFIKLEYVSNSILEKSLKYLIEMFNEELDQLDTIFKENLMRRFLDGLGILHDQQKRALNELRDAQIKANVELNKRIVMNPEENKPLNTILKGSGLRASVEKIWDFKEKLDMMVPKLYGTHGILLDSIIGSYCAGGNVTELSRKLASYCKEAEKEVLSSERARLFDGYYVCLMRLSIFYPCVKLEEIVSGADTNSPENKKGVFYRWCNNFVLPKKEENSKSAQDFPSVSDDQKREFKERILHLQDGEPFWNEQTQTSRDIIEMIPLIGSVLLDFCRDKRSETEYLHNAFKNVVSCFRHVASSMICLSQWLENQESNDIRRTMGICVLQGIEEQYKWIPKETAENSIWPVIRNICNYYLSDICNPVLPHPLSITLKSIAIRSFPNCSRLQVPDPNILKDVWLYAQRQNWFNHKTLSLIDRCNQAEDHRTWIRFFINYLMRLMAQDVMAKALEFICAILLLDPINSILIILELLFEYLLQIEKSPDELEESDKSSFKKPKGHDHAVDGSGIQHEAPHVLPLVKLTVQVMLIGVWLVDFKKGFNKKEIESEPDMKRLKTESDMETRDAQLDLILPTIRKCIQHMNKEVKQGIFTPAVSAVMHIVKNIAASSNNRCKDILLTLIPPDLVFRMGLADPCFVPFEMFQTFCDPKNFEHSQKRVRFLCMLRTAGAL
ncbi:unnamed protein product [Auanema sp. JU1783]|nr:unnamed protein product [Auanema sp. JU1783]